ncbi:MAG: ATPase [Rhodospirillaceae bacterium]|nr:ATPase [Rhodospirillaceae bacterium]|tara:strand:- start:10956 stop:11837 length:882 start_codon:yes stop_codon:yes gene_type:complete
MILPETIEETEKLLLSGNYVSDRSLSTSIFLSLKLNKPLFLEGEAGVGKTELAYVLSKTLNKKLIRLQCYEGLDISSAAYEWNYPAQMIEIRLSENISKKEEILQNIYSEKFLTKRPLLQALDNNEESPILLIDELDRTDAPFEAFLLEILSDFQLSIPEYKTFKAKTPPLIILTSNRTREIHDAIKRRCFYHWIDYPSYEKELNILKIQLPKISNDLNNKIVKFVQELRKQDLYKLPGVSETIDWASAITNLNNNSLEKEIVENTLGALLKYQDDIVRIKGKEVDNILNKIK